MVRLWARHLRSLSQYFTCPARTGALQETAVSLRIGMALHWHVKLMSQGKLEAYQNVDHDIMTCLKLELPGTVTEAPPTLTVLQLYSMLQMTSLTILRLLRLKDMR